VCAERAGAPRSCMPTVAWLLSLATPCCPPPDCALTLEQANFQSLNFNAATKDEWVERTFLNETNIRFLMETDANYRQSGVCSSLCASACGTPVPAFCNAAASTASAAGGDYDLLLTVNLCGWCLQSSCARLSLISASSVGRVR
jgi:hypothetical protein